MKINKILALVGLAALLVAPLAIKAANRAKDKDVIVLTKDNTVQMNEEVNPESVATVIKKLQKLDQTGNINDPIYLVMFTPGGDIMAGTDLIDAVHGLRRPVNTITLFAASMGFQIVQNLGDRLILKNGVLMSHRAAGGMEGYFGGEEPSQLTNRLAFFLNRMRELDMQTVARTKGKQTLASYQHQYSNEMWLGGTESVEQGYADKIVSVSCSSSLDGVTRHVAHTMFGDISYDLSDCPLITSPLNIAANVVTNHGIMTDKDFIAQKGRFDAYCMQDALRDNKVLCSLDTTLSVVKLEEVKTRFQREKQDIKNHVVRY